MFDIRDVRLDETKHVDRSLVQLNEDAVVDLTQTKKLQDLPGLRRHAVDTTDTGDERHLRLGRHVEVASGLGLATKVHFRAFHTAVLLHVFLGALEDDLALLLTVLEKQLTSVSCTNYSAKPKSYHRISLLLFRTFGGNLLQSPPLLENTLGNSHLLSRTVKQN